MSQFYVPDSQAADRCQQSADERKNITVTGVDVSDNRIKAFTGAVQSVQDFGADRPQGSRWLVTMPGAKIAT